MKLTKDDLNLVNGVAPEKSRPILGHVCLRKKKLVVADGFMLIVKDAQLEEGDGFDEMEQEEVLFPPKMLGYLKPTRKGDYVKVEMEPEDATLAAAIMDKDGKPRGPTLRFLPGEVAEKAYPKYETILREYPENKAVTAIDVKLLRKLLKCLPDEGAVRIKVGEPTQPVEFSFAKGEEQGPIRAFIMPWFVNWEGVRWANDDPTWKKEEADEAPDAEHGAGETSS